MKGMRQPPEILICRELQPRLAFNRGCLVYIFAKMEVIILQRIVSSERRAVFTLFTDEHRGVDRERRHVVQRQSPEGQYHQNQ